MVGLGNPGRKYEHTRHNAGFLAVDLLCQSLDVRADQVRHQALLAAAEMAGHRVILAKPQTFMNLSGQAVAPLARGFDVPPERVLVLYDDAAMPAGRVRVRRSGSAGGHNGIKSIIASLETDAFPRVKLGIGGPNRVQEDMVDFVLDRLDDQAWKAIRLAPEVVETFLRAGAEAAMQAYNGKFEEG